MRGSEYNQNKSINPTPKGEYSPVQRSEYSPSSAELGKTPKFDLNSTSIRNESVEENTTPKTTKKTTVTHAGQAAKTASSGAHVLVTAAAIVSTTVVATTAGIHLVNDAQASAKFTSFIVTDTSLSYNLSITSTKEDSSYTVRVYNSDYDKTLEAFNGNNEGTFDGLKPSQLYHVEIKDKLFVSTVLYDEVFYTKEDSEDSSLVPSDGEWLGLVWDKKADFIAQTVTVQLSFQGQTIPYDSIFFALEEKDNAEHSYEFYLEHTLEQQEIYLGDVPFEWNYVDATFVYSILAYSGEEKTLLESGETKLENSSSLELLVNDPNIYDHYSSSEGILEIGLNYQDPFGFIEGFTLSLTQQESDRPALLPIATMKLANTGTTHKIPLRKTKEIQQVDISSLFSDPRMIGLYPFSIELSYTRDGQEVSCWNQEQFEFIDDDGPQSEITQFVLSSVASRAKNSITIELGYNDEANQYVSFYLLLTAETGEEIELYVEKVQGEQTIVVEKEGKPVVLDEHSWNYEFGYYDSDSNKQILRSGSVTFAYDEALSKASIDSFALNNEANFLTGEFSVSLTYTDPDDEYEGFYLDFTEGADFSLSLEVSKTSGTQTLYFVDEHGVVNLKNRTFDYSFGYIDADGNRNEHENGQVTFTDVAAGSFTVDFRKKADFIDNTFEINYHFDDPNERISGVVFKLKANNGTEIAFPNDDLIEGVFTCFCGSPEDETFIDLSSDGPFEYSITYLYDGVEEILEKDTFDSFEEMQTSYFENFSFDPALSLDNNRMYYDIDYVDKHELFSDFKFEIEYNDQTYFWYPNVSMFPNGFLDLTYDSNSNTVPLDSLIGETVRVRFSYLYSTAAGSETITVLDEDRVFTREARSVFHGAALISNSFNLDYPNLSVEFFYYDDNSRFSDLKMVLVDDSGAEYLYEVDPSVNFATDYQMFDLTKCLNQDFVLNDLLAQLQQKTISLGIDYLDGGERKREILIPNLELVFE